jgi:hypothetical protein
MDFAELLQQAMKCASVGVVCWLVLDDGIVAVLGGWCVVAFFICVGGSHCVYGCVYVCVVCYLIMHGCPIISKQCSSCGPFYILLHCCLYANY